MTTTDPSILSDRLDALSERVTALEILRYNEAAARNAMPISPQSGGVTIRQGCRQRIPLSGADAQALEGALSQVEGESRRVEKENESLRRCAYQFSKDLDEARGDIRLLRAECDAAERERDEARAEQDQIASERDERERDEARAEQDRIASERDAFANACDEAQRERDEARRSLDALKTVEWALREALSGVNEELAICQRMNEEQARTITSLSKILTAVRRALEPSP